MERSEGLPEWRQMSWIFGQCLRASVGGHRSFHCDRLLKKRPIVEVAVGTRSSSGSRAEAAVSPRDLVQWYTDSVHVRRNGNEPVQTWLCNADWGSPQVAIDNVSKLPNKANAEEAYRTRDNTFLWSMYKNETWLIRKTSYTTGFWLAFIHCNPKLSILSS